MEFVERNRLMIHTDVALEIMRTGNKYEKEVAQYFLSSEPITDVMEAGQDFLDFMVFSWMKAKDESDIQVARFIDKLSTWMRILGREDVSVVLKDDAFYAAHGRPALRKACELLGIGYPSYL